MGLAERRAAKNFETNLLPGLKKQINEAAGFDVLLDVKWDTLAVDGYAESYDNFFPTVYFRPLIDALKAITIDDMGKEALKSSLKAVIIQNTRDSGNASAMPSFSGGTLTLDHSPSTNLGDEEARARAIRETLEKVL